MTFLPFNTTGLPYKLTNVCLSDEDWALYSDGFVHLTVCGCGMCLNSLIDHLDSLLKMMDTESLILMN